MAVSPLRTAAVVVCVASINGPEDDEASEASEASVASEARVPGEQSATPRECRPGRAAPGHRGVRAAHPGSSEDLSPTGRGLGEAP